MHGGRPRPPRCARARASGARLSRPRSPPLRRPGDLRVASRRGRPGGPGPAPGRRPLPAEEGLPDAARGRRAGAGGGKAHRGRLRSPRGGPARPRGGPRPGRSCRVGRRARPARGPGALPGERPPPARVRGRPRRRPRRPAERRGRGALAGIARRRHARRRDPRAGRGRRPWSARAAPGRGRAGGGHRGPCAGSRRAAPDGRGRHLPRRRRVGPRHRRRAAAAAPRRGRCPRSATPARAPRSCRACRRDGPRLLHAREAPVRDGAFRRPRARAPPDDRVPWARLRAPSGEPAPHVPARLRPDGRRPRRTDRRGHGDPPDRPVSPRSGGAAPTGVGHLPELLSRPGPDRPDGRDRARHPLRPRRDLPVGEEPTHAVPAVGQRRPARGPARRSHLPDEPARPAAHRGAPRISVRRPADPRSSPGRGPRRASRRPPSAGRPAAGRWPRASPEPTGP